MLDPQDLLIHARDGDREALGALLEQRRAYLGVLARRWLDRRVQARLDASDVVQATFLEAHRDFERFQGKSLEEFTAWLRRILENNALETLQRHASQKRSLRKERRLEDAAEPNLAGVLADSSQSSPSQRAMRGEAAIQLAAALERLPEDQREAIRLRHLEGWTLTQLAEHFGRSDSAVAGLLKRGLRNLRKQFPV